MFELRSKSRWVIGFGVFFPLSFQLSGGIYRDQVALLDSGEVLATIPLPLSLVSLIAIIALWPKHLARVYPALASNLGMCVVYVISLWSELHHMRFGQPTATPSKATAN